MITTLRERAASLLEDLANSDIGRKVQEDAAKRRTDRREVLVGERTELEKRRAAAAVAARERLELARQELEEAEERYRHLASRHCEATAAAFTAGANERRRVEEIDRELIETADPRIPAFIEWCKGAWEETLSLERGMELDGRGKVHVSASRDQMKVARMQALRAAREAAERMLIEAAPDVEARLLELEGSIPPVRW